MNEKNYPTWPGWETVRLIGRGSFGTVYEIQRDVFGDVERAALKHITIPQSDSDVDALRGEGLDDESITETFKDEARDIVNEYKLMKKLNDCPNVVSCDDVSFVQHGNGFGWDIFIKMEMLTPLLKSLGEGRDTPEDQVVALGKDICRALCACQKQSIIHRDIKPQNIFVSESGLYKLGDFGIARTKSMTSTGTAKIGSYDYMAPEVFHAQRYGAGADFYSLGMVLYWLLNRRRCPFQPVEKVRLTLDDKETARKRRMDGETIPAPVSGSEGLKQIVLKACAYDPKDRYQSAEEMLHDLENPDSPSKQIVSDDPVQVEISHPPVDEEPEEDGTIGVFRRPAPSIPTPVEPDSQEPEEDGTVGVFRETPAQIPPVPKKEPHKIPDKTFKVQYLAQIDDYTDPKSFDYSLSDADVTITGYHGTKKTIAIPPEIDGKPVIAIGNYAFDCTKGLTEIVLPEGLVSIGDFAFWGCAALTKIVIPNSVGSIGKSAFWGCSQLSELMLPDYVFHIGESAFYNCSSLRAFSIPRKIKEIEKHAFSGCKSLTSMTIPDNVTAIGASAFRDCERLKIITIPESVRRIGARAFDGCRELADVFYSGSNEQWKSIAFSRAIGGLIGVRIHYNSEVGTDSVISE